MRDLVLSIVCAVLGMAPGLLFASECEQRLTTSIAKVTRDALASNQITLEEIKDLVDAEIPQNPLRFRTPGSGNASLSRFYALIIAKHVNESTWAEARAELRSLISRASRESERAEEAKADTAEILAPQLEQTHSVPGHSKLQIFDDAISGTSFILDSVRSNGAVFAVDDLISGKEIASVVPETESNGAALGRDQKGRPILKAISRVKMGLVSGIFRKSWEYKITTIGLTNGDSEDRRVTLPAKTGFPELFAATYGGTDVFKRGDSLIALSSPFAEFDFTALGLRFIRAVENVKGTPAFAFRDGENKIFLYTVRAGRWEKINSNGVYCGNDPVPSFESYALHNGMFTIICRDESRALQIYHPFAADPGEVTTIPHKGGTLGSAQAFEMNDGRFFLVVFSSDLDDGHLVGLDVYEPFKSATAVRRIPRTTDFIAFERDNRFYVLAQKFSHGGVQLIEPLASDLSVTSVEFPGKFGSAHAGRNGQINITIEKGPFHLGVFSLFHKP